MSLTPLSLSSDASRSVGLGTQRKMVNRAVIATTLTSA